MAILDTIDVIATNLYNEKVLGNVFRYTGSTTLSTTEMELTVIISSGNGIKQNVRFRRGGGSVYIHDYDIAIPAGSIVMAFEFREIGSSTLTATASLSQGEYRHFNEAGILYIDEIRFRLNVTLGE